MTHYFITRAIVEVAAVQSQDSEAPDVTGALWEHALSIRDLLKYEFFFATKHEFDEEIRFEASLAVPGWREGELSASDVASGIGSLPLLLAHRVIGPFLEAYLVVADRLATREPAAPVDRDSLVAESLGVARQRWLQQQLHSPESISKDLMNGAVTARRQPGPAGPGR